MEGESSEWETESSITTISVYPMSGKAGAAPGIPLVIPRVTLPRQLVLSRSRVLALVEGGSLPGGSGGRENLKKRGRPTLTGPSGTIWDHLDSGLIKKREKPQPSWSVQPFLFCCPVVQFPKSHHPRSYMQTHGLSDLVLLTPGTLYIWTLRDLTLREGSKILSYT